MNSEIVAIIEIQPDSSIVQALIKCDSAGRARLEEIRTLKESRLFLQLISSLIQQVWALKDNKLTAKTVIDSLGIYMTYKERHIEERQAQTTEIPSRKKSISSYGGRRR